MSNKSIVLAILSVFISVSSFARTEQTTVQGSVGRLSAEMQIPEHAAGEKIPWVVVCHGFSGNKNEAMHRAIADSLERHGIASIRFDFNGHGQSDGDFSKMTVLNEIEDAKCVISYVAQRDDVKSIAIVGHSQGGVVAAMTSGLLGDSVLKAAVLISPAAVLRDDALRGTCMGRNYDAANPPATVELYGGLRLGRDYILSAQRLPIYETAKRYQGPVLVIHGDADRVVPYTYGQRFADDMRYAHIKIIPGMDHGYSGHVDVPAHLVAAFMVHQLLE